ncbi:MAG TPA: hypothetical protein VN883_07235, partial [Myxococcales bacterium]|nr:hypothetical protein [Myxococcales bacterium]
MRVPFLPVRIRAPFAALALASTLAALPAGTFAQQEPDPQEEPDEVPPPGATVVRPKPLVRPPMPSRRGQPPATPPATPGDRPAAGAQSASPQD